MSSYVQSVIMPNEDIVTIAKTHWFIYVVPFLWLMLAIVLLVALYQYTLIPSICIFCLAAILFF